jgi:hypothetical protein
MKSVTRYNYAYIDPTKPARIITPCISFLFKPLYVGKGGGDRMFHGVRALEEANPLLTNELLYKDLKQLMKDGHEPQIVVFNEGSNDDVLMVEEDMILQLGRRKLDQGGILCNRALGGAMPDCTGMPKSAVTKTKMVKTRRDQGTYTTGAKHPRARSFTVIAPDGSVFLVVGAIKKFCEEQDLSWQTLYNNRDKGKIMLDRSKYRNLARLTKRFWNTIGWECKTFQTTP